VNPFPHLLSPIRIGPRELPNRIVHEPTDIGSPHANGEVSERDICHLKKGAAFGLNLDEEMLFNPNHAMVNELGQLRRPEVIELK